MNRKLTVPSSKFQVPGSKLPFVFSNFAMTADGKIAFANRKFIPFSSRRDHEHMMELRATADAVMAGARTVEAPGLTLGPGSGRFRHRRLTHGLSEYNLRIIVSRSGSVNPHAEIFRHHFSPIIVLTADGVPEKRLRQLRSVADEVKMFGETHIDFPTALRWLRVKWNVKRLLCEGGAELHWALIRAGLVNELHLTICPIISGGRGAPTIADGHGFDHLEAMERFDLKSKRQINDELFTVFEWSQSEADLPKL